jgi:hypothetical protein
MSGEIALTILIALCIVAISFFARRSITRGANLHDS